MNPEKYRILAINPGSTSTKVALYEDETLLHQHKYTYSTDVIGSFQTVAEQEEYRLRDIHDFLERYSISLQSLSAVVGRGGITAPVKSGAYFVNELMLDRVTNRPFADHASNYGSMLAYKIAKEAGVDAYVYDSVTMDELNELARMTGIQGIERWSRVHALNMRAVAMKAAAKLGKRYADVNLIVAHLGGGITLSVHEKGRMTDIVFDMEGPLAPERAGRVPITQFLNYSAAHKLDLKDMHRLVRGKGGLVSLCGTNDFLEVASRVKANDAHAALVVDVMAYQCAKSIGELATVVCGEVDTIVLTGPIAYSDILVPAIIRRVQFIAPVELFPGENEMESLTYGVLRVLRGEETARVYDEETDSQDRRKEMY